MLYPTLGPDGENLVNNFLAMFTIVIPEDAVVRTPDIVGENVHLHCLKQELKPDSVGYFLVIAARDDLSDSATWLPFEDPQMAAWAYSRGVELAEKATKSEILREIEIGSDGFLWRKSGVEYLTIKQALEGIRIYYAHGLEGVLKVKH